MGVKGSCAILIWGLCCRRREQQLHHWVPTSSASQYLPIRRDVFSQTYGPMVQRSAYFWLHRWVVGSIAIARFQVLGFTMSQFDMSSCCSMANSCWFSRKALIAISRYDWATEVGIGESVSLGSLVLLLEMEGTTISVMTMSVPPGSFGTVILVLSGRGLVWGEFFVWHLTSWW